jgi:hypothetical protein
MKKMLQSIGLHMMIFIFAFNFLYAQTYEATLVQTISTNGDTLRVDIYLRTTSGISDKLGDAVFGFVYNKTDLTYIGKDFHLDGRWDNDNSSHYADLTASSNPADGEASLNVYPNQSEPYVGLDIPVTATRVGRVRFFIDDKFANSGVAWEHIGYTDAYKFGTPPGYTDDDRIRDKFTFTDPEDFSLPVAMSAITAEASKEDGVTITWRTESELNSAGFHVWRSLSEDKVYNKITSAIIPSQGNTSVAQEYSYSDKNVESDILYWYKIEELSTNGESKFFGPISVMGVKPVPKHYGLGQNYPNPFNPETMIEFQLPENADVAIVVYSLLGQEVKTLVKEKMEAGYQKIAWYGKDNNDVKVPSGMYIIQMQAGDFRQIRKMTIIR